MKEHTIRAGQQYRYVGAMNPANEGIVVTVL